MNHNLDYFNEIYVVLFSVVTISPLVLLLYYYIEKHRIFSLKKEKLILLLILASIVLILFIIHFTKPLDSSLPPTSVTGSHKIDSSKSWNLKGQNSEFIPHHVLSKDYISIPVLFGTDRNRCTTNDNYELYGKLRNSNNDFEVGILDISIPKNHKLGNIERPNWLQTLFNTPVKPSEYISVLTLGRMDKLTFTQIIKNSKQDEAFLFIHGYNNTFRDAAFRTAQLSYDLGFKGIALMFSWPSNAQLSAYSSDEDNIVYSIPHIKKFIELVTKNKKIKKIHLIAHSMGNRGIVQALDRISREKKITFDEIILAAPDIDAEVFKNDILPNISSTGKSITIYATSRDKALFASEEIHRDNRLGQINRFTKNMRGVNVIDVSDLTSENIFNHDYIFTSRIIIEDLNKLLIGRMGIENRNFIRKSDNQGEWWAFKK